MRRHGLRANIERLRHGLVDNGLSAMQLEGLEARGGVSSIRREPLRRCGDVVEAAGLVYPFVDGPTRLTQSDSWLRCGVDFSSSTEFTRHRTSILGISK